MNILFLDANLILPVKGTGSPRAFNFIKRLSQNHELRFISYISTQAEEKFVQDFEKVCSSVTIIPRPPDKLRLDATFNVFKPYPMNYILRSPAMEKVIIQIQESYNFDVVHINSPIMTQYLHLCNGIPTVIDPHDSMSIISYHNVKGHKVSLKKVMSMVHWLKVRNFERDMYRDADHCLVVSSLDKAELKNLIPPLNITVLPNGVDSEYYQYRFHEARSPNIIFTGTMDFPPNVDAMLHFCHDIFPLIKKRAPDISLYIVGRNPTSDITALANLGNIVVTGLVADIRTYIQKCSVFVCPMRIGSGIKNKILEAMSMGIPVVANMKSVEALDVTPDENIIIAEDPQQFAEKTLQLIEQCDLRKELAENGRKLVENNYTWDTRVEQLEKIYHQVITHRQVKE